MIRYLPLFLLLPFLTVSLAEAQTKMPKFKKIVISDKFHAEGSCIGDFNKDGIPDVAIGHFWYEGPDFKKRHQFFEGSDAKDFDPKGYSNCFGMFSGDFNGDGWDDILICPHPGADGFWYENPKNADGMWKKHPVSKELGNESQFFGNILGTGQKSLLFNRNGYLGFATSNTEKPYEPWNFIAVNDQKDDRFQKYTHGIGFGDINGNGKMDILDQGGWWECPADPKTSPWKYHKFPFADAAAHMVVYDVDGDGLNDVVLSTHCHLYGFAWYKQVRKDGEITFEKQVVIPRSDKLLEEGDWKTLAENQQSFRVNVSQLHASVLVDMNGDGIPDVVTGKRFWAHGPTGDTAPDDPAILMWWETKRDGNKATLVPHIIDEDSGVGTQFAVGDLNGDGIPDIVIGNKKGAFVFLSEK
jgi:hypothetical protein